MEVVRSLAPMALIFLLMVIFLVLPARRHRQRVRQLLEQLQVGDEVMTQTGQYAKLIEIEGDQVVLEIAPGVHTRWAKGAIAAIVTAPAQGEPAEGETQVDVPQAQAADTATTSAASDPQSDPAAPTSKVNA